ncbi:hypothetical protein ACGF7U_14845 [Micromonospora sp. NPDC047670]|uniref:hypothetical protein n=1 Tax=Micromonospora sp. NPDC047670 TaxID=3364252 RepID=UPI00371D75B0
MGLDLSLADVAAAVYQYDRCRDSGKPCHHDPNCAERYQAVSVIDPWEFRYRQFVDIREGMLLTGMGYEADIAPWEPYVGTGRGVSDEAAALAWDVAWRSQTTPGRLGIPLFKLGSNDRWIVTAREIDEALVAYAKAPASHRAELESRPKWVAWLEWLALSREHGGFEVE